MLDLDQDLTLAERYAILPLKNVAFLHLKNLDGSAVQMERLKFIATKLGKSVRTLKLEFDGPDMQMAPDNTEFRKSLGEFAYLERLILSVYSGNSYKHMIKQAALIPDRVPMFNQLRHIEIYDIVDQYDSRLDSLASLLKVCKQRYALKFFSG